MYSKLRKIIFLTLMIILIFTSCAVKKVNEKDDDIKVVTTYKVATNIVLALNGVDDIVGIHDGGLKEKLYTELKRDKENNVLEVGSKKHGINVETILALKPDVIIMYDSHGKEDNNIKTLEDNGIKVLVISPEDILSLKKEILRVAKAIGKEKNGEKLVQYFEEKEKFVKERVENITNKKRVFIMGARGFLSTTSGEFYQSKLVELAGGNDIFSDLKGSWNQVSIEEIMKRNPDVIFSLMYTVGGSKEEIINSDYKLKCIDNGEVYRIPSNIEAWDMPTPSSILGIMYVSIKLYPERYSDFNFKDEVNNFYKMFYRKSFEELGGNFSEL